MNFAAEVKARVEIELKVAENLVAVIILATFDIIVSW